MPLPPLVPPRASAAPDPHEAAELDALRARDVVREGTAHLVRLMRLRPAAVALAVLGSLTFVAGVLVTSMVVGGLTDRLLVPVLDGGAPVGPRLRDALLALAGVGVWRSAGITLRRTGAGWAQFGAVADLRRRLVRHQLGLSLRWYARQRVGDLLAVNDGHVRTATFVLGPLPFATGALLLSAGSIALVVMLDPVLGTVVGGIVLAAVLGELVAAWRTFAAFEVEQHRKARVARVAHESIDGAQTVAALGRRAHEVERFAAVAARQRDSEVLVGRRWSWFRATLEVVPSLLVVPVAVTGTVRVAAGALSVGDLVTATYLLSLLTFPLAMLGFLVWDTAESLTGWRRVAAVLDASDQLPAGQRSSQRAGPAAVAATGLGFGYGQDPVLDDLSLRLRPGTTIGLVGATASGKSTVVALLARLWDPDRGQVEVDGTALADLRHEARTTDVALVGQEAFVFADTVRGNVLLGHQADDDAVWAALETAGVADVVAALPHGLETVIGERGATLSGGQRQRLALARALVRRPRVLLLDDATSAVDPSVEAGILRRLRAAASPSTTLVVATRPATVALCDEVLLLAGGAIAASGTHQELLAEPAYATLMQAYERDRRDRSETVR